MNLLKNLMELTSNMKLLPTETMEVKEEKWEWMCFWTPDREKILEQTLTLRIDELFVFNENKLETLSSELSLSQNRILEEVEEINPYECASGCECIAGSIGHEGPCRPREKTGQQIIDEIIKQREIISNIYEK